MDLSKEPEMISSIMYSNQPRSGPWIPPASRKFSFPRKKTRELSRLQASHAIAFDEKGEDDPQDEAVQTSATRLFEVYHSTSSTKTPRTIAYGEDNRDWGGAFAVYRGLTEALPYHRFFNAPISESAIVGSAVGYAVAGGRAIVELMYADFIGCAGDEIFNQLSKWQAMSAGILKMPVVLRVSVGSKYGAQHSQDWTALCSHIPGLKVCFPATPYDAKGLMNQALNGTDPVIFFESQRIYDKGEEFHEGGVPTEYYEVDVRRSRC